MLKRNILIFHLGALGDFVLTWPLALGLARIHPQSRVIYITHPSKGELAEKVLGVESASIESGWHHLLGDAGKLPAGPAKLMNSAHSIYSYISSGEDDWSQAVRSLVPEAKLVCLNPNPPAGHPEHATDFVLAQLAGEPAAAEAMRQMIRSVCERGLRHLNGGSRTVLIHPGSGSPAKCWAPERFVQLAHRLSGEKLKVRFVLGEVELDRWPPARVGILEQAAPVDRPSTPLELLDVLSGGAAYVGNDSGPTHLAAAIGLPTLALFGPTSPSNWRPLGRAVQVMQQMPMDQLEVDTVFEQARQLLAPK